jgi:hypothetical protein
VQFSFLLLLLPLVIFGYVGCMWLLFILFSLLVVADLSVLVAAGVLLCSPARTRTLKAATTSKMNKIQSNHVQPT